MTEKTFDNTNHGALFRNDEKRDEKDRDYAGTLNVDGKEYWVSGWARTPKKGGQKFLSLSIKPKDAPQTVDNKPKAKEAAAAPFDDTIGF
jgi:hypothetical protein